MTRTDILGRISSAFQDVTNKDQGHLEEQSVLRSLGIDSLDFVEAIVILEQELGVQLEDKDVDAAKTVADMIDLIEQKRAAAAAS